MWAQTYKSGSGYYREHRGSRRHTVCPAAGAGMHEAYDVAGDDSRAPERGLAAMGKIRSKSTALAQALAISAVGAVLAACGSDGGAVRATPEPTAAIRQVYEGAVTDGGTPVHKAGTPNVEFAERIGDCVLGPGAECPGADFSFADLSPSRASGFFQPLTLDMTEANLRGADFRQADLTRADFTGADLRDANFTGARLLEATLYQADLRGADLSRAVLTFSDMEGAKVEGAIFCETRMPDGSDNNEGCP